jgi:sialidase-1
MQIRSRHLLRPGAAALGAALAATTLVMAPATAASSGRDFDARPAQAAPGGEGTYVEQDLALNGRDGFPNYRIPALAVTNKGTVLASYDGRPTAIDAPGPNSILQRRSHDGGTTWEAATVVRAGRTSAPIEGYSDPSYVVDRETGRVHNFFVQSFNQGFIGSRPGTDPGDRNVLHAAVSHSDDDGVTWTHRTITADITPDLGWRSRFAASGQGIQLRYGPHAGRLIQQFTIINAAGQFQAVSVYSDDHGETWQAGEPVGVGMDENKVVELSDGRVMLNSRDSHGSKFRKVAYSEDGGVTYGPVTIDRDLPDPTNNASIIRAFPNAPEGSDRAKVLLFSNAASQTSRSNGTIRMSCDDGESWPVAKAFRSGSMSYSTLATLPDGRVGLLYEPGNGIRFASFDLAWLEGVCAPITAEPVDADRGATVDVELTVTNQAGRALPGATVTLEGAEGWAAERVALPVLTPGVTATVTVPLTVPESARGGSHTVSAVLTHATGTARGTVTVEVARLPHEVDGAITVTGGTLTNPQSEGYQVGDVLRFTYRVTNVSPAVTTVVPSGNLRDLDPAVDTRNCRWRNLPAYDAYNCGLPYHVITQEDLDRGWFEPVTTWVSTSGASVSTVEHTGTRVQLG